MISFWFIMSAIVYIKVILIRGVSQLMSQIIQKNPLPCGCGSDCYFVILCVHGGKVSVFI